MQKEIETRRGNFLNVIKFKALYLLIQMKISVLGCFFARVRNFRSFFLLIFGFILLVSPTAMWAQQPEWPWRFEGGNFQITNTTEDNFLPSVAAGNGFISLYIAVWSKKTPSGFDIYGARITKDGKLLDSNGGFPICTAPDDQMAPSVIWGGGDFLVVWQDRRSGKRWDIYGARVTLDGKILEPDGIPIAVGKSTIDQMVPAIGFNGESYLVLWQGKRSSKVSNIYFKRVSKNGEVLDSKPVVLNPSTKDQVSPFVACDGMNYFVVWQDFRNGKSWEIYGARVASQGEILDQDAILITNTEQLGANRWKPVLAWNGDYYLVVWMASPEVNKWYLYGKRVNSGGQMIDVADRLIQKDSTNKAFPVILWGGSEYLLVWEENPEGDSKIFGMSIFRDGYSIPFSESRQISDLGGIVALLPAASSTRDNAIVIWEGKDQNGYWQIFGQSLIRK